MPPPRVRSVLLVGVLASAGVVALSLGFGLFPIAPERVLAVLLEAGTGRAPAGADSGIVLDLRLPRALGAWAVGAGLGTAGVLLQALLRNPLASPFVIGTAQGAGFGAMLALLLGLSQVGTLGLAFAGSVLALSLVLALARGERLLPVESVVLTGLGVSLLFGALAGLVRYLAADEGVQGRMVLWVLGGLWHVTWPGLALTAPALVVAVVLACLQGRRLDLLALGPEEAERLGLNATRAATLVLALSCVLTSLAVCLGGVVAFVGLLVPHAARRLVGPGHVALLPAAALLGGAFVVVADVLARTALPPNELPLTVVTSLLGTPAFLLLLRSLRSRRRGA